MKRVRNVFFLVALIVGFIASREANGRTQIPECFSCTGWVHETCEPCQGGEECAKDCYWLPDEIEGGGWCYIDGERCVPVS